MSKMNGILYVPIKIQWLQMIADGIKKEEYREIKPYWTNRFTVDGLVLVDYHTVVYHGYGQYMPVACDVVDIRIGTGREEWGAVPGEKYYITEIDNPVMELSF